MIVFTEFGNRLVIPETTDLEFLKETVEKLEKTKNRKKIKQILKSSYLKYRNIPGLELDKTEYGIIEDIMNQRLEIKQKLLLVCGSGTVCGAIMKDVGDNLISPEEALNSPVHFCTSEPRKDFNVNKFKNVKKC